MKRVAPWYCQCSVTYIVSLLLFWISIFSKCTSGVTKKFSNQWVVEIEGGNFIANQVASAFDFINHGKIFPDKNIYLLSHQHLKKRSLTANEDIHLNIISHSKVKWAEQQLIKKRVKRGTVHYKSSFNPALTPNDPEWNNMWYLLPSTEPNMHVKEAWIAGFSGKNITISILDDGIDFSHPDLYANYDSKASWDLNENDSDPTPRFTPNNENQHGTRCAGAVAATANNSRCCIGIAYGAKFGGVRMLDGIVTDAIEAWSLSFKSDYIDIYSASWGPVDDGWTVEGPGKLANQAFLNGVTTGRGGKGSIFIFSSGNGGYRDDCNCDGYCSSIYTLSINSVTQRCTIPWYIEMCSSVLAATYSSGSKNDAKIVSTDLHNGCTSDFTGTSASAPLAAGICALALEANSNLTWRDMQHIIVQTAQPNKLTANDWTVNGAGRKVSHAFGFGLMNAYRMVMKATNWTSAPKQRICVKVVISDNLSPRTIPPNISFVIPVEFRGCEGTGNGYIDRLEHVQAVITVRVRRRKNLAIYLTSAMGTKSRLLAHRPSDNNREGFTNWTFMTTHAWDEDPRGMWMLEIENNGYEADNAILSFFKLVTYGTLQFDWPASQRIIHVNHSVNFSENSQSLLISDMSESLNHSASGLLQEKKCEVFHPTLKRCLVCSNAYSLDLSSNTCVNCCAKGFCSKSENFSVSQFDLNTNNRPSSAAQRQSLLRQVCRPCSQLSKPCSNGENATCLHYPCGASVTNSTKFPDISSDLHINTRSISIAFVMVLITIVFLLVVVAISLYLCRQIALKPKSKPHVTYQHLQMRELSSSSDMETEEFA